MGTPAATELSAGAIAVGGGSGGPCGRGAIGGAWARTMSQALDHYCKYLITVCNKNRWSEAKATVQQLLDECIHGFLKEGVNYRKMADNQKQLRDAVRLAGFPEIRSIKREVKSAMAKLHVINKFLLITRCRNSRTN